MADAFSEFRAVEDKYHQSGNLIRNSAIELLNEVLGNVYG